MTEPPVTKMFSDDQIDDFIKEQHILEIPKFPCHAKQQKDALKW